MAKLTEILQLAFEVTGTKDVAGLRSELSKLADEGDESAQELLGVVRALDGLAEADRARKSIGGLKASLSETRSQLQQAEAGLIALNKQFSFTDRSSAAVSKKFRDAAKAVEELTAREKAQTLELQRTEGALAKAGVNVNNLTAAERTLANQTQVATTRIAALSEKLRATQGGGEAAAKGVKSLGAEAQGASGKLASVEGALTKIVSVAAAVAVALKAVRFGTDALAGAADLEAALSEVQAVAGAGAEELRALRDAAQAAAGQTGVATNEIVGGLGELARAGLSAKDAIAALKPTLDLAQAGGLGLSEAVTIATTTLTQFGLSATDAQRVADVLAQAANSSQTSVQGLGLSLSYAAPLARQLGLSLEDTTSIIAALGDEGFRGERAGTALRNVFSALLDPSSAFRGELEKLNIRGNDFGDILQQLASKGEDGKRALLALDSEARPAILALFNKGGESIRRFNDDLENSEGAANRTAAVIRDNLDNSFKRLKNTFDNTLADLIEPVLKPLQGAIENTAAKITAFANSPDFDKLQDGIVKTFQDGLEAAKQFAQNVDFQAILDESLKLATEIRGLIGALRDFGTEVKGLAEFGEKAKAIFPFAKAIDYLRERLRESGAAADELHVAADAAIAAVDGLGTASRDAAAGADSLATSTGAVAEVVTTAAAEVEDAQARFGAAFAAIATDATSAGQAVIDAFTEALETTSTVEQVERLGAALKVAFEAGKISASAFAAAQVNLRTRTAELTGSVDELSKKAAAAYGNLQEAIKAGASPELIAALRDEFKSLNARIGEAERGTRGLNSALDETGTATLTVGQAMQNLGITSQRELERTRDSAKQAFETIAQGARTGEAAAADVRRAFVAYGQAAIAAAKDSGEAAQRQVEAQLRAQAAAIGVKGALEEIGVAGTQAGKQVADGADKATEALNAAADASTGSAAAAEDTRTALGGVLGALVAMYQKFSAVSPAAAEFFKEAYNGSVRLSTSLASVAEKIARAEKATDAAIATQLTSARELTEQFDRVAEAGEGAGLAFESAARQGEERLRQFADQAREGRGQLELLNQADLDALSESATKAADKIAAIKAEAKSAGEELAALSRSLQDDLDRRAGNEAAVLEREHQDRLRRIKELADTAGEAGRQAADEARALAERDYQEELARINGKAAAEAAAANRKKDSDDGAGSTPPTSPPPRTPSGGGAGSVTNITNNINAPGQEELLRQLARQQAEIARRSR